MNPTRTDRPLALLLTAIALTVYVLTLTPSLSYLSPDGSELATIPAVLGLAHSPGYPLYTWMGFLFSKIPIGDVAHRINLMSAVLGALGVGGLYLIITQLLPGTLPIPWRRAIAALCALLFAFSLTFWSQALIAEVYAPNIALVALTLLALLRWERTRRAWDFFLFALLFALSLGTHLSDLGFAPAFTLFTLLTLIEQKAIRPDGAARRELSALTKSLLVIGAVGALGFALGVAQFAWLPLRAGTLNDRFMLRNAPTDLKGLYRYTLGAFPQFKFAFPIQALPDRLVIYLYLLRQQFGFPGIALGIPGLFSLLFRRPRHFHLLAGMYLVHVWFFIQYRAFDLEVFFIPAHFLWAIFIAFGLYELLSGLHTLGRLLAARSGFSLPRAVTALAVPLLLPTLSLIPLSANWSHNDLSQDVAVNDFYANVWELLPPDAALVTPGGVFGYDAFYWQIIYGTRSDVLLPTLPGPDPSPDALAGRKVYATIRAVRGNRGPGALPPDLLRQDLWAVPVLVGEQPEASSGRRGTLVLYRMTPEPPDLLVRDPRPQIPLNVDFGSMRLIGADLSQRSVESGAAVEITFYWQVERIAPLRVEVRLGERVLEQHEVGLGLLQRYAKEIGLSPGDVVREQYSLVIPSTMKAGAQVLSIQAVGLRGERGASADVAQIEITNETGTMERWLQIAGK